MYERVSPGLLEKVAVCVAADHVPNASDPDSCKVNPDHEHVPLKVRFTLPTFRVIVVPAAVAVHGRPVAACVTVQPGYIPVVKQLPSVALVMLSVADAGLRTV
jgi:hypothetical protein